METDLQEELRAILTKLENAIAHDILLRQSQSRSSRSPKSIHAEAIASLTSLITRELEYLAHQEQIHDPNGNPTYGTEWCIPRQAVIDRIKTLTPGGNDNETN